MYLRKYIDNLLRPSFEADIASICPPEFVLKKTTKCTVVVSYLDVTITVSEKKFLSSVHDKKVTCNFPFYGPLNQPTKCACTK